MQTNDIENSIYNYCDPRDFLKTVYLEKLKKNSKFSLRSWSRQIGLDNHALLSMVLSGKRRLKPKLAKKIEKTLNFQHKGDQEYFQLLVALSNASYEKEKELYVERLAELHPKKTFSKLDITNFRIISDWYHVAILEMISLKDFQGEPTWIANRLGDEISVREIEKALKRLKLVGLIEDVDGKIIKVDKQLFTDNDIPNDAIKNFHYQMIEKAKNALAQQDVNNREITGYTMTINKEQIPLAKKMIRDFQKTFAHVLGQQDNGDATYQFNMQFFELTKTKDMGV